MYPTDGRLRPFSRVFRRLIVVAIFFSTRRLSTISGPMPFLATPKTGLELWNRSLRLDLSALVPCRANNTCCLSAPIFRSGCISVLMLLLDGTYLILMLRRFPRLAPSPLSHRNYVGFCSALRFGFCRRPVLGRNKCFLAYPRGLKSHVHIKLLWFY